MISVALVDDMLSDAGNAFSIAYFDFERGRYIWDYQEAFSVGGGNEFFGVLDNWENYHKIRAFIDRAYQTWKSEQGEGQIPDHS